MEAISSPLKQVRRPRKRPSTSHPFHTCTAPTTKESYSTELGVSTSTLHRAHSLLSSTDCDLSKRNNVARSWRENSPATIWMTRNGQLQDTKKSWSTRSKRRTRHEFGKCRPEDLPQECPTHGRIRKGDKTRVKFSCNPGSGTIQSNQIYIFRLVTFLWILN